MIVSAQNTTCELPGPAINQLNTANLQCVIFSHIFTLFIIFSFRMYLSIVCQYVTILFLNLFCVKPSVNSGC